MRTIVIDTEFSAFSADAKLISIAAVDPLTDKYFYAELIDWWCEDECDPFVQEHVLIQLDPARHGMSRWDAARGLVAFLDSFGEPVQLACDAVAWDFSMLEQLFDGNWPSCIPNLISKVIDLSEEADAFRFGDGDPFPHHALIDAQILASVLKQR